LKIFRPVKQNWVSQRFGENRLPMYKEMGMKGHSGIDFVCKDKAPLYFDVDIEGLVIQQHVDSKGGLGLDIVTREKNGDLFKHRYWHLHSFNVVPGDVVESGDLIGWCDNTGRSTGTHLHRGLKPVYLDDNENYKNKEPNNGYFGAIDPMPYFKNIYIKDHIAFLKIHISLLKQMVELLQNLLKLIKK